MRRSGALLVAVEFLGLTAVAQAQTSLSEEMHRLGLRSALVLQSQAVDEHPVWSPKGDALAVNLEGKWMSLPLGSVTLIDGKWHGGQSIGVLKPAPTTSPIDEKTVRGWEKAGKYDPRRVETR